MKMKVQDMGFRILFLITAMAMGFACQDEEATLPPVISGFSPTTGRAGTTVTISGSHFSQNLIENTVSFNGIPATVTQASKTSLTVTVPDGTLSGKISVDVNGQAVTSAGDFEAIHTVYAAGFSYSSSNNYVYIAEYWKEGVLTSMTDGTANSAISGIDVVGPDVYLAGTLGEQVNEETGTSYAVYWKNGVMVKLTDGTNYAEAKAIDVVGNDVHVVGVDGARAVYWKNGVPTYLTDGTTNVGITGLAISGNDVYVVGYENSAGRYWKNGVAVDVGGENAFLFSIAVSGSDVYVAGYYNNDAYFWKNGAAHKMPNTTGEAAAWSIALSGNDIYVAGRDGSGAVYWKNDTRVDLEDGSSANAIFIIGNDVYVAGEDRSSRAKYWKNGAVVNLTEEESGHAAAAAAIVVR